MINGHGPELILDANVLCAFIVGQVDPELLGSQKRVKEYKPSDHELIVRYVALFKKIILLPNVTTEACNLLDHFKGQRRQDCLQRLLFLVEGADERYVPSREMTKHPEYMNLGMTDCAILHLLASGTYLLTADRPLWATAQRLGCQAEHIADLRGCVR